MPYLPGKDLFHKMKSRTKGLTPQRARRILREVIHGLLYMKKHRIAHRYAARPASCLLKGPGVEELTWLLLCDRL